MSDRTLKGYIRVRGRDDEPWPLPDQPVDRTKPVYERVTSRKPVYLSMTVRWGGECRVEIRATADLDPNGNIHIHGTAVLFEGVTEDTNKERDRTAVCFDVPPGGEPTVKDYDLISDKGDYAIVTFRLSNSE